MKNYQKSWLSLFVSCLLLFLIYCSDSSNQNNDNVWISDSPLTISSPKILVVYDSGDKYGIMCYHQTKKTLNYGKIPFDEFDLSSGLQLPELFDYSSVAVATEMMWKLDYLACNRIKSYVKAGGGLAVLFRTWNEFLLPVFGVVNTQEPEFFEQEQEIVINSEFLPGSKNLRCVRNDISNYTFQVNNHVEIIASTKQYPIVWIHNFGKGKVVYWNTSLLSQKINRGFITRSIAAVQPATAVVIANIGLLDIDDYPNSSSNEKIEPIKSEFDKTISEFYTLQWYPDMIKLAKRYGLKYTSVVVFNYNGQTSPPYQFYEWLHGEITLGGKKIRSSIYAGRTLTKITELGLHGYNHQPLTVDNWGTIENMKLSLSAAKKRWQIDNLGDEPFSYIPPLNIIDSTGFQALKQVFPTIKEIGSLYLGETKLGQYREYGPEPWDKNFYVIPRNTSGFILTEFYRRSMISLLNANGVWAHFVHPDDVYPLGERYDEEELRQAGLKKLSWHGEPQKDGLYYHFIKWLDFAKANYPWLRYMTRKEAYKIMQRYDKTKIGVSVQKNFVNLETNVVPCYFAFYLRNHNQLEALTGCQLIHKYKNDFGEHFIFKATEKNMFLYFKHPIASEGEK